MSISATLWCVRLDKTIINIDKVVFYNSADRYPATDIWVSSALTNLRKFNEFNDQL